MNEAQREYKKQMSRILRQKVSLKLKLQMLASFQQVLKQHIHIQSLVFNQSFTQISMVDYSTTMIKPITENESTKFSQSLSMDNMTVISQQDIRQVQEMILSKKIVKIQNYEVIETLQEQLYAIEDSIECKRKYNEHLRKQIDKKMVVIQEEKERSLVIKERSASVDNKFKHNRSFSDYLKFLWH